MPTADQVYTSMLVAFVCLVVLGALDLAWPQSVALAGTFHFTRYALALALTVFVIYPPPVVSES